MTSQQLLVTNFAYGIGPFLRTTELALAFNDVLEREGRPRLVCLIPWVYGEKQRCIMLEEFGEHEKKYPGELLLDEKLGGILRSVFYGDNTYTVALAVWVRTAQEVSKQAREHLSGIIDAQTLSGEHVSIEGKNIVVEINRSPRIRFGVAPSYFTTFGYIEDILRGALEAGRTKVNVEPAVLERGIEVAHSIEKEQRVHAVAFPGTFSGRESYLPKYPSEILVPPIRDARMIQNNEEIEPGIFVTVTGIPGLERLYREARDFGLRLYANDLDSVPGSVQRFSPNHGLNKNIVLHFARSGWGSVWLSMLCGTPILVPDFDPLDDPEIYFNNKMVEELGFGTVYRGQPLAEILAKGDVVRKKYAEMREKILKRWGTLDGNQVCAEIFVKDFLSIN
ncbi:MAG: hypothetical protein G01um101448_93 [Parcubacteria group bacterium Gr01-1014_48]|nr:MAG: hypothetical protein Greene041614_14 [Parcubacteria group bacterium Greene0416_14]TSC74452.1 MAG: hypothetical protein G01um101448_93 [Parcubacteria group bacterium Gr01-1014_48]TSD01762.1 MAG: hypothetical protein Greene101415_20 [Parcubacteria group bacterium Greene1014_15]TSD08476.1 MAG: hypothetical protein Greene07144_15 [Parcubacteria group bacterium Greene0714_4]